MDEHRRDAGADLDVASRLVLRDEAVERNPIQARNPVIDPAWFDALWLVLDAGEIIDEMLKSAKSINIGALIPCYLAMDARVDRHVHGVADLRLDRIVERDEAVGLVHIAIPLQGPLLGIGHDGRRGGYPVPKRRFRC